MIRMRGAYPRLAALTVVLGLAACGSHVELPPAKVLVEDAGLLPALPTLKSGAHASTAVDRDWSVGGHSLRIRAVLPQGDGPFPVVVFSHGFASDERQYDALFKHWASHGYVILAPYHADGGGMPRAIFNSLRRGNDGLVAARVADVKRVLDHLDQLDALSPGLSALVNRSRIAVAGHSFGAFTAQQFGGAATVHPDSGQRIEGRDERVRAVMAISPPGEMFDIINAKSWLSMDTPMLATTGTWDVDGRFVTDWRQHRLSFDTARPGNNWLLVIEGADHYLGNLICRPDRNVAPQADALRMVNALSVTFLDAFLRSDPAAQVFLKSRPLAALTGDFATLSHR